MLGRGDWKKIEDAVNAVLVPLGERVTALEAQVAGLESPAKVEKVNIRDARTGEELKEIDGDKEAERTRTGMTRAKKAKTES